MTQATKQSRGTDATAPRSRRARGAAVLGALALLLGIVVLLPAAPSSAVTTSGVGTVVAGGATYGCAVRADGQLACWGQIGSVNSTTPVIYPGLAGVRQFAAASAAGCAVLSNRSVKCFGDGTSGQLGNNTLASSNVPVTVNSLPDAISITAGANHFCAARVAGGVRCWGANGSGQLGNGTTTNLREPGTPSSTNSNISGAVEVAAGSDHTCIRRSNGRVSCWGANADGQLGVGTTTGSTKPLTVTPISDATAIVAGGAFTCALSASTGPRCWGDGSQGALGNGSTADATIPTLVSGGLTGLTSIGSSAAGACAIAADTTVSCWGTPTGDGTSDPSLEPKAVPGITGAAHLSSGFGSVAPCVITSSGAGSCWGAAGGLGDGSGTDQLSPIALPGGSTYYGGSVDPVVPVAPVIKAAVANEGYVQLSWTAPIDDGGSPVTGYVVTPYLGSTPQSATVFENTLTSQAISGLSVGSTYTFTVAAINAVGTGPASAASNEATPRPVLSRPGPPTDVTAAITDLSNATVTWTAPTTDGGLPLQDYVVTSFVNGAAGATQTVGPTQTSATFTGLTNAARYNFRVDARNERGSTASVLSNAVFPCQCIPGRVLDTGDAPLANVRVRAIDSANKLAAEALTDETGTYVLLVASPTAGYKIQFADKFNVPAQFPLQYRTVSGVVATETATTNPLVDRIVVSRSITGRLLDLTDVAIPNARVRAIDTAGKLGAEATTDASGNYRLDVSSPTASYKVQFADKSVSPERFPLQYRTVGGVVVTETAASSPLLDRIAVRRAITGTVIDGVTGQPVAGLRLRALKPALAAEATSAADGTFTLDGLSSDTTYIVQVADKRPVPVYPIRWYANSVNQAGAQAVAVGSHITFVVWPS